MNASTMTVAEYARKLVELGPDSVTDDLPERVLVYIARKWVAAEHRSHEREQARRLESEARVALRVDDKAKPKRRTSTEVVSRHLREARREAWALVLGSGFSLPGGRWATWGTATIEEHEARIRDQRELIEGIEADVSLHEQAIADLREFGIERLAEL